MTTQRAGATLRGTVVKIIESEVPSTPEQAEIVIESADHRFQEIRIENTLKDKNDNEVGLKLGAQVQVTVKVRPPTAKPPVQP